MSNSNSYGSVTVGSKIKPEHRAIGRECPDSYVLGVLEVVVLKSYPKKPTEFAIVYEGADRAEANAVYQKYNGILDGLASEPNPSRKVLELIRGLNA